MVGGEHHPPRVLRQQEQLQPDRPLHGVRVAAVLVLERHHPAAALALGVGVDPLGVLVPQHPGQRRVGGHRGRLAEHHHADVGGDVGVRVDVVDDRLGGGAHALAELAAVAVELDVRHVHAVALGRLHGVERGRVVAAVAEVVAVHVRRVRQAQLVDRLDEGAGHLQRRQREGLDALVDVGDVVVALPLPLLVAAGIDQLHAHRPRRVHPPGDGVPEVPLAPGAQQVVQEHVVAEQHVEALVDHRRVVELLDHVPRRQRRHRGVEGGGVAERGVAVAGGEGRGRDAADPGAGHVGARVHVEAVVLRLQLARQVDLGPGDVGVDVDPARHHHHAVRVDPARGSARFGDHPAAAHAHVPHRAVDAVGRVVHPPAGDAQFRSVVRHAASCGARRGAAQAARRTPRSSCSRE